MSGCKGESCFDEIYARLNNSLLAEWTSTAITVMQRLDAAGRTSYLKSPDLAISVDFAGIFGGFKYHRCKIRR